MSFLEKKIIFPSTPVPGINNDQSLNQNFNDQRKIFNCYLEIPQNYQGFPKEVDQQGDF